MGANDFPADEFLVSDCSADGFEVLSRMHSDLGEPFGTAWADVFEGNDRGHFGIHGEGTLWTDGMEIKGGWKIDRFPVTEQAHWRCQPLARYGLSSGLHDFLATNVAALAGSKCHSFREPD